ncbi:MAG: ATPase domain-containing protein [archaeon]
MASVKKKELGTKVHFPKRVPTGIPGFDELVDGGFPANSAVLISGSPGVGKSVFCMQYLLNGAKHYGEEGLYVTFEQKSNAIVNQAAQFGWDLHNLQKKGKLHIMSIPVRNITKNTIHEIKSFVKEKRIKRLVVDSLSTIIVNAPIYQATSDLAIKQILDEHTILSPPIVGDYVIRRFIYEFIEDLRELGCTSLLISEAAHGTDPISRDTLSEFACDGIVALSFTSVKKDFPKSIIVRKMRQTRNDERAHPLEIDGKGIIVHHL